ncbi:hypothetical protein BDQ17DRAFT_1387467 [Cyathus striatus]|nr:hypothetical protein BDQ17DRAFT_1387467 [Cyathus striatus]
MVSIQQFLAEEEKFWTQLVLRLHRSFDLHEAQSTLISLGLLLGTNETENSTESVQNGRNNHFQFPPEDPATSAIPTTPANRESRLAILTKALICLGDIARYREQYNEARGRPRAGHEDLGPARRGRRKGESSLSSPSDGNPYHQLAILASYQRDAFFSIIHYYRALCVRQPYDTAAENLSTMLLKTLESWRSRMRRERDKPTPVETQPLPPRIRIDNFKEKIVVLHALWRVGLDKGIEKMDSIAKRHDRSVFEDFYALVSERHMPVEMISNTIVLSQGALWKHRMLRDTSASNHSPRHDSAPPPPGTSVIIEWRILDHIFDLHRVLLEVGKEELKDPPPMETNDLAQRITATFRRTLPALRIASKWLRANYKYVMQDQEFVAFQEKEKTRGVEISKASMQKISGYSAHTVRFWKAYAEFIRLLGRAFPAKNLPSLTAPLEEDVEMRGFLPLKKLMGEPTDSKSEEDAIGLLPTREQVHPNVEQLMRISDILEDAKILAGMENSPVPLVAGTMLFNPDIVEQTRPPTHPEVRRREKQLEETPIAPNNEQLYDSVRDVEVVGVTTIDDDSMTETTSITDDDVVRDAFRHLNVEPVAEDEQEDEIVYMRGPVSPPLSPPSHASPKASINPISSPSRPPRSPIHQRTKSFSGASAVPPAHITTTAQDLLNDVMSRGSNRAPGNTLGGIAESSAPQPPLLFGSDISTRQNHSIWSASRDEQSLRFSSAANGTANPSNHAYQARPLPPQNVAQPVIWSSPPYVNTSKGSQQSVIGTIPNAQFTHGAQPSVGGHQRMPSAPVVAAQLFPNPNVQHDPFGYAPVAQQHVRVPESQQVTSPFIGSPMHPENGQQFYSYSPMNSYHNRHVSTHDPHPGDHAFHSPQMSMSQVWGNVR